jgi:dihydroorotate dehydrogenase electron transfer subunit
VTETTIPIQDTSSPREIGLFDAVVTSNRQIGPHFHKLKLTFSGEGARAFANCVPGQFAELDVSGIPLPAPEKIPPELADVSSRRVLLRRPFSFTDVTEHGDKTVVDILYCVLGPATLRLTSLKIGTSISVIGPLGNGFHVPEGKKYAYLIAGGMGTPPLQHLAKVLAASRPDMEVMVFAGAKSRLDLPVDGKLDEISMELGFSLPEFARYGIESLIATDDGSIGFKGFVSDCFVQWLKQNDMDAANSIICACGPEKMLARIAQIARDRNIDCQISMERRMACGTGLCQGCAVEYKSSEPGKKVYKMCCQDGPVFDSKEVIFAV